MGIPFNELNRVFDLGFKSFPWGDTGYLKSNLSPAGTVAESSLAAPKHLSEGGSVAQPKSDVGGSSSPKSNSH